MPRFILYTPSSEVALKGPLTIMDNMSSPTNLITYDGFPKAAHLSYVIQKNGEVQTGNLIIAFDGTETSITDTNIDTSIVMGIKFYAEYLSAGEMVLKYTSQSTGFPATFNYYETVYK